MSYVLYLLTDQADYLKRLKPPSDAIAAQIEELEQAIAILKQHSAKVPAAPPELVTTSVFHRFESIDSRPSAVPHEFVRDYPHASD